MGSSGDDAWRRPPDATAPPYGDAGQAPPYGDAGQAPPYGDAGQALPDTARRAGPLDPMSPEDRTWALLAHLGAFVAAYLALGFLAPLVVLLLRGERSTFVQRHARESLNFQLTSLLVAVGGAVVGGLLTLVTLGLALLVLAPVAVVWVVFYVVVVLVASRRAYDGRDYRYPLTLRLLR